MMVPIASLAQMRLSNEGIISGIALGKCYAYEQAGVMISYPGINYYSKFIYDGIGRCAEIDEYTGGTSPSTTEQFVWCGSERCEEIDTTSSGTTTKLFFSGGENITS